MGDYWDNEYEEDLEENEEYEEELWVDPYVAAGIEEAPVPTTLQFTLIGDEDGQNITVFQPGQKPLVAHSTHPSFDQIKEGVLANDASVLELFDVALTAGQKFERLSGRITTRNNWLYLDGEKIDGSLADQVVRFLQEGVEDWKPLVAFFENVVQSPNDHSRKQLYDWITAQEITITEDGLLVGYKGVKEAPDGPLAGQLVSLNSGTAIADGVVYEDSQIPNKVGTVVEMPRTEVMHNPVADCDAGLHVGSYKYAKNYGSVLLEVHVNPRDVVSVPDSAWKLRTCRYEVIKVIEQEYTSAVLPTEKPKKQSKLKKAVKKAFKGDPTVRVGDVYEDTDKRRAGRTIKVIDLGGDGYALATSLQTGKETLVSAERLTSRKYKRIKRGKKS